MSQFAVVVQRLIERRTLRSFRHQMFEPGNLLLHFAEQRENAEGLIPHGGRALEVGLLFEESGSQPADQDHLAAIRFLTAGDEPEYRGLAGAVSTDEADPVAGIDLKRQASKDLVRAVAF